MIQSKFERRFGGKLDKLPEVFCEFDERETFSQLASQFSLTEKFFLTTYCNCNCRITHKKRHKDNFSLVSVNRPVFGTKSPAGQKTKWGDLLLLHLTINYDTMYSLIIEMRDVVIGDLRYARIGKLLCLLDHSIFLAGLWQFILEAFKQGQQRNRCFMVFWEDGFAIVRRVAPWRSKSLRAWSHRCVWFPPWRVFLALLRAILQSSRVSLLRRFRRRWSTRRIRIDMKRQSTIWPPILQLKNFNIRFSSGGELTYFEKHSVLNNNE